MTNIFTTAREKITKKVRGALARTLADLMYEDAVQKALTKLVEEAPQLNRALERIAEDAMPNPDEYVTHRDLEHELSDLRGELPDDELDRLDRKIEEASTEAGDAMKEVSDLFDKVAALDEETRGRTHAIAERLLKLEEENAALRARLEAKPIEAEEPPQRWRLILWRWSGWRPDGAVIWSIANISEGPDKATLVEHAGDAFLDAPFWTWEHVIGDDEDPRWRNSSSVTSEDHTCIPLGGWEELEPAIAAENNERRIADRVDGYDRDDLGESPDF
jgi:hypothetical protein